MNIVWLKTGPLHPLDTGGKIRTYHMLRELKKKHALTYLALCPASQNRDVLDSAGEYSTRQAWIEWKEASKGSPYFYAQLITNLGSSLPYVIQKYRSQAMQAEVAKVDAEGKQDMIVCDFLTPSVNLQPVSQRRVPVLLFQHNVESLIWRRLYENASGLKRLYFGRQWKLLEDYERRACAQADAVVGVSEEDCQIMRERFGLRNVLGAVPTGVDIDYFASAGEGTKRRHSMVFLGSMDWMPNIDGAEYFIERIFPFVRRQHADATLTIVGRNPPKKIIELAGKHPGIRVTGTVADVRPWLAEAEVMIVPLRIGGGTRIKIFEGMAASLPVVSTRIGAEGLPLKHQEDLFLEDDPEQFARRVCDLFADPALRRHLGTRGRELVARRFSWAAATELFENYCNQALTQKRQQKA